MLVLAINSYFIFESGANSDPLGSVIEANVTDRRGGGNSKKCQIIFSQNYTLK